MKGTSKTLKATMLGSLLMLAVGAMLLLGVQPGQALGTVHEVANAEWTQTAALSSTTLVTNNSGFNLIYNVQGYITMPSSSSSDSACMNFTWTDEYGAQSTASQPTGSPAKTICGGVLATHPGIVSFPVRVANGTTLSVAVSSSDTIEWYGSVVVTGY